MPSGRRTRRISSARERLRAAENNYDIRNIVSQVQLRGASAHENPASVVSGLFRLAAGRLEVLRRWHLHVDQQFAALGESEGEFAGRVPHYSSNSVTGSYRTDDLRHRDRVRENNSRDSENDAQQYDDRSVTHTFPFQNPSDQARRYPTAARRWCQTRPTAKRRSRVATFRGSLGGSLKAGRPWGWPCAQTNRHPQAALRLPPEIPLRTSKGPTERQHRTHGIQSHTAGGGPAMAILPVSAGWRFPFRMDILDLFGPPIEQRTGNNTLEKGTAHGTGIDKEPRSAFRSSSLFGRWRRLCGRPRERHRDASGGWHRHSSRRQSAAGQASFAGLQAQHDPQGDRGQKAIGRRTSAPGGRGRVRRRRFRSGRRIHAGAGPRRRARVRGVRAQRDQSRPLAAAAHKRERRGSQPWPGQYRAFACALPCGRRQRAS